MMRLLIEHLLKSLKPHKNLFMRKIALSILSVCLLIMFSCSKPEESKSNNIDPNDPLIGIWKFTSVEEKAENGTWEDIFQDAEECQQNDLFKFMADGTFIVDEGASKCDSDDPQIMWDGFWSKPTATLIKLKGIPGKYTGGADDFNGQEYKIDKIEGNILELSISNDVEGDLRYKLERMP